MWYKQAMPYADNTFYHVTDRSNLSQIQQQGLTGSKHGTPRVWGEFPVEENAVYLHPNIGGAHSYAKSYGPNMRPDAPRWQDPVVLRVRGIDRQNLSVDHESLTNYFETLEDRASETPDDLAPAEREILEYGKMFMQEEYREDLPPVKMTIDDAIKFLRALTPDLREFIAKDASETSGDTLMHYGPVPPENIDVGHIQTDDGEQQSSWEQWSEAEPQEWTEEQMERGEDADAYSQWYDEQNYLDPESEADMEETAYEDPTDDSYSSYYNWTPLQSWKQANAPGAESWATPSNTHTQMADPTGNADGLDMTQAPGPRIPCYCDVGLSTPHEWAGSCEKGTRPTMQYEAAMGSNWVYIEGQVAFGRHWFQIAQDMLLGQGDEETTAYVTNMLARNTLPSDLDIAIGSTRNGRVQIWESTLDRNAVWDAVNVAKDQQKVAAYDGVDWEGNPRSFDPETSDPNDMRDPVWHPQRADYFYGTADQVMEGDGVRLITPPRPDLDQSLVVQSVQSMGDQIAISFYPRHVIVNNMLGESGLQPDAPQQTPQDEPLLFGPKDAILIRG